MQQAFSSWSSSEEALARCEGLVFNVPLDGGTKCHENATAEDLLGIEGTTMKQASLATYISSEIMDSQKKGATAILRSEEIFISPRFSRETKFAGSVGDGAMNE